MLNNLRRRHRLNSTHSSPSISNRRGEPRLVGKRISRIESLEPRLVLTAPSIATIAAQTLQSGLPQLVPINASGGTGSLTYSVTSSNPSVTADLLTGNPILLLNVTHTSSGQPGDSTFSGQIAIELFPTAAPTTVAQIESLVNAGDYTNTTFYRIVQGFVIQGGFGSSPMPASSHEVNNEFDSVLPVSGAAQPLAYTGLGVVGLARQTADNTGSTEFFIQNTPAGAGIEQSLDNNYTIFGQVVSGLNLITEISSVPNNPNAGPSGNLPDSPVTITSASITTSNVNFALGLSAPLGTSGSSTITVKATDSQGKHDFAVVSANTEAPLADPPPTFQTITTPSMPVNQTTTFTLPITDVEGDALTITNESAAITGLNVAVDSTTHLVTLTPTGGLAPGVYPLTFQVSSSATAGFASPHTVTFPLFVDPAALTGLTLESASDTGFSNTDGITSLNNSSASQELQFQVTGATTGDTVILLDGTTQIGSAVATGSTVVVTTNGSFTLANGTQNITAEQEIPNQSFSDGDSSGTTNLASSPTSPVTLTIDATAPTFTSTPPSVAIVNIPLSYTAVATDFISSHLTYALLSGPTGISVNSSTGALTWTPTASETGTSTIKITATDAAGNIGTQTFNVTVFSGPPIVGVSTTTAPKSTVTVNGVVPITITFGVEPVTVTGTPTLTLNDGGVAKYVSGSGTNTLTFDYTVASGQNTPDLDYALTTALSLSGGTIADSSGNAAILTLPATGTDGLATADIQIGTSFADLAVTLTASPTTMAGGAIIYTATVTNKGPNAAQGVKLTDTLAATTSFGSESQTSGSAFTLAHSGNAITDTIASLASGASATFTITADLLTSAPATTVSDTVTVSSATQDTNSSNNTATATTTVTATGVMLMTDADAPTLNELVVDGTSGADNVTFGSGGAGKVTVTMDGRSYGTFAVTGRIVAYAGATGNDTIIVSSAVTLPTFLYAGSGTDELVGGGGNNVLVGGTGADTLIGGTGHNILIAGTGPSKLYSTPLGAAASVNGGSIMIAGTTSFDHNESALSTIMAEWASNDSYATRISKIRGGTLAGGVALNTSTIVASKAVDQLYASTGYDWFWALSPLDQMLNISPAKKSVLQIN